MASTQVTDFVIGSIKILINLCACDYDLRAGAVRPFMGPKA